MEEGCAERTFEIPEIPVRYRKEESDQDITSQNTWMEAEAAPPAILANLRLLFCFWVKGRVKPILGHNLSEQTLNNPTYNCRVD